MPGVEFPFIPESNGIPLVCDVSSNILTRPIDVNKFGVLFAGAQKNLGCAGVTVVIVRKSLIGKARLECPSILNWKTNADASSILNTPPTFSVYVLSLMLDWVIENGGVEEMERRSHVKSSRIHNIIDESDDFYCCPVDRQYRSRVNITFRVGGKNGDPVVENLFLSKAKERGFIGLEGHRSVGGIRVSLYNSITIEDTEKLALFMIEFLNCHKN
ncbi:Phosphoserine aminotransferase [Nymphon striatum]|nr:Phosphoserine aminotransferase [Nymphon striatum]